MHDLVVSRNQRNRAGDLFCLDELPQAIRDRRDLGCLCRQQEFVGEGFQRRKRQNDRQQSRDENHG
jgi:hypothetical protein